MATSKYPQSYYDAGLDPDVTFVGWNTYRHSLDIGGVKNGSNT